MKFTLSWLKTHLETDASLNEISATLTAIGLEVEEIINPADNLREFVVAEILEANPHPNADKLQVCKVNNGSETLQIVCGAPNARAGIKVVLAPIGVVIPTNNMVIKQSKIRDVESCGMLCSASELGLGEDSDGIMELPDTSKVGDKFVDAMNFDDPVIEIAITPNRGDCLGVYGIARDLAAAGLGKLKNLNITKPIMSGNPAISCTVADHQKTPLFISCQINNVKNSESPAWLKNRLESIGKKSISTLVDITNFLTFDLGRPAHVYDADKLKGDLTVRIANAGEKIMALDELGYELDESMLVIADDKSPQAIAGVIGGLDSGCSMDTKNIVLEIAVFDPVTVAKTGRKLGINSDARYRFERGIDQDFAKYGALQAINLILDLCGGAASELQIIGNEKADVRSIKYDLKTVEKVIGLDVEESKQREILEKLGFSIDRDWNITIPSYRHDVIQPIDIVEEVIRMVGFDALPESNVLNNTNPVTISAHAKRLRNTNNILSSRGLHEAVSFSFMSSKDAAAFNLDESLKLSNPISVELDVMRGSIIPNLLKSIANNNARKINNLGLFEIGPIFDAIKPGKERLSISAARVGEMFKTSPVVQKQSVDIFDIKADLANALECFIPLANLLTFQGEAASYYHPARSGVMKLGNKLVAQFGEIHPQILKYYGIKQTVVAFEIDVSALPPAKTKSKTARAPYKPSDLQSVTRDFALLVDENTPAGDLLKTIAKTDKKNISNVEIFDCYQGDAIEKSKKSIALSVELQPTKQSFTDQEIEEISTKIIAGLEKNHQAILRK